MRAFHGVHRVVIVVGWAGGGFPARPGPADCIADCKSATRPAGGGSPVAPALGREAHRPVSRNIRMCPAGCRQGDFRQIQGHRGRVGVREDQADEFPVVRTDAAPKTWGDSARPVCRPFWAATRRRPAAHRITRSSEANFILQHQAQGPGRVSHHPGVHFGLEFFRAARAAGLPLGCLGRGPSSRRIESQGRPKLTDGLPPPAPCEGPSASFPRRETIRCVTSKGGHCASKSGRSYRPISANSRVRPPLKSLRQASTRSLPEAPFPFGMGRQFQPKTTL